jgi:hypothetical protein
MFVATIVARSIKLSMRCSCRVVVLLGARYLVRTPSRVSCKGKERILCLLLDQTVDEMLL